ncbi:hypothetical protein Taro_013977 [Colocasia esculenta]|uniref:Uncharacterized protein n=1 Tax=Colocasia esculenta TaxID=4460 RepID=A0A843UDE4_COLES|nr:hypothetical protein [Colocasia esculenta]
MWKIFHKLRMDYDTYSTVVAPLRLVCLVSLETPDVEDIPQTENGQRHLFRSCYSFEMDSYILEDLKRDPRCGDISLSEAGLRDLKCGKRSTKRDWITRPQVWETFHKLRMNCDICLAVAAPLRLI